MDDADPRKTDATRVAERLRDEIVRGVVPPASKLKLAPLADRYGIGRAPLREAASKLAAEQLLEFEDHRGYRVAPISREDLLDVTLTRRRVETLALSDAMEHGSDEWEGAVLAALHRLSKCSNLDPNPEARRTFSARHREFHDALVSACPSRHLLRFRSTLYAHSERYRALAEHRYRQEPSSRDVPAEHRALAEAAVARDREAACAHLEAHIQRTAETLLDLIPAAPT